MRKLLQDFALSVYGARPVQAFVASPLGRRIFEHAYLAYKSWIEAPDAHMLRPYVAQDNWVVDVGANIGFFTEKFARWTTPPAQVLAIEPEDRNCRSLSARLERAGLAGRVRIRHGAATDRDGRVLLSVRPEHPGDHRLALDGDTEVSGWRIDTLLKEAGQPSVGFIKIDVQGAEMQVLQGAAGTIERCRPVLFIEVDDSALKSFGSSPEEVVTWLSRYDYSFHLIQAGKVAAIASSELPARVRQSASGYLDVLAVPSRPKPHPASA